MSSKDKFWDLAFSLLATATIVGFILLALGLGAGSVRGAEWSGPREGFVCPVVPSDE